MRREAVVECHSGHTYAEQPVALHWEGQRLEIKRVLMEAHEPDGKHFRVQVSGGDMFALFYVPTEDEWLVEQV